MFQYISCCSLSIIPNTTDSGYYCFNTSHVVVYRAAAGAAGGAAFCFNTSHVVVYLSTVSGKGALRLFQYISCCSLSLQVVLDAASDLCFNTSHVVVYRHPTEPPRWGQLRFNTSHVVVYQNIRSSIRKNLKMFQYISCCSLSKPLGKMGCIL